MSAWWSVTVSHAERWQEQLGTRWLPWAEARLRRGELTHWFYLLESSPALELRLRFRPARTLDVEAACALCDAEPTPYQPELARWGGELGFEAAARYLHVSSLLLARALGVRPGGRGGRAAACMLAFARAFSSDAATLLAEHGERLERAHGMQVRAALARRLQEDDVRALRDAIVATPDSSHEPLACPIEELRATLHARALTRAPRELAHELLHLTVNRLGVPPADEAVLAYVIAHALRAQEGHT